MTAREPTPARRRIRISIIAAILIGAAAVAVHIAVGIPAIEAAYRGESAEWLNRIFAEHRAESGPAATLEHYQLRGRVWLCRGLTGLLAAELLLVAWLARDRIVRSLRSFAGAEAPPIGLAVFRIAIFSAILAQTWLEDAVFFSSLSPELEHMPAGVRWLGDVLPFSPEATEALRTLLRVVCISGILGLFARASAFLAAILGAYVLGVPQFFGKVNHFHHLLWFAAILSASRCADVLSIDAAIAAGRRAARGDVEPPGPSRGYALPLRLCWIVFGLLYFFPGFWKWWRSGIDWAVSDNMRYQLYWKWQELDGWLPFLRIDRIPLATELGGLGTIAFELGFIAAIFHPRVRQAAVAAGIGFHLGVLVFMNILFWSVLVSYSAFVDWGRRLRGLGRTLFGEPLIVLYDGNCGLCRRTIAILRSLDMLECLRPVNALDAQAVQAAGAAHLDPDAMLRDMHSLEESRTAAGYASYLRIARRLPPLWPLLPFLHLPLVAAVGRRVYRHVADTRTCEIPSRTAPNAPAAGPRPPSARPAALVATAIAAAMIICGAGEVVLGWPVACYPTFSSILSRERTQLAIEVLDAEGRAQPAEDGALRARLGVPRLRAMVSRILETPEGPAREAKLVAFWRLLESAADAPDEAPARRVRFVRERISVIPEELGSNPISREVLLEYSPAAAAPLPPAAPGASGSGT